MESKKNEVLYKNELAQRQAIMDKIRNGNSIDTKERTWLMTHSLYNTFYGIDAYNISIEKVPLNRTLKLSIVIESCSYSGRIIPIISVPAAQGNIFTTMNLRDYDGHNTNKPIKMLGIEIVNNIQLYKLEYISELGLLGVHYGCDYYDEKLKLCKRESSSTGNPNLAMKKEILDEQAIRYYCKSPLTNAFDALVFRLSWE